MAMKKKLTLISMFVMAIPLNDIELTCHFKTPRETIFAVIVNVPAVALVLSVTTRFTCVVFLVEVPYKHGAVSGVCIEA